MAWDWLRIEGEGRPEAPAQLDAPRLDAARNALVLPAGSRLDYFLDAAPGSVLEVAGVEPADDGPKPAKLAVEIATRETTRRVEVAGAGRIALSGDETGPLRVSFAGASGRGVRVLGATLSSPVKPVPAAAPRPDPHVAMPNIVVFLVDTLRADHLGCYGYPLPTSPRIDAFAAEATLFANFQAQSPWTRPSVASLFTGLTGPAHQANHRNAALSEEAVTLAELLRDAGYQTAAFALNSNIDRKLGLAQGFQVYRIGGGLPLLEEEAMEWLGNRPPNRRFFLYLHHMDPHVPYDPREPYREAFARGVDPERGTLETMQGLVSGQTLLESEAEALALRRDLAALYDAEVASNDERFGRVLDRLRELGLYDDALVLFVADHGEEFFEHGWWAHGKTLHGEQLRVPFIAKFPRGWGAGRRVTALAQQVDVLPTVLDYLGREVPAPVQGRSLLLAVAGHEEEAPPAFAFVDVNGRTAESVVDRSGRWKLIRTTYADRPRPRLALYDLASDPGERRNLAPDEPVVAGWLETLLEVHTRDSAGQLAADPTELDEDIESRLRALGYVGE
jgi:arylsulfatase A-like enzyme